MVSTRRISEYLAASCLIAVQELFSVVQNAFLIFFLEHWDHGSDSSLRVGRDNSVDIATGYGLDVPGIESRWGEVFHTRPDMPWGPPSLLYNG
jgi:hypothetical protein